jgi:hypothetical protein
MDPYDKIWAKNFTQEELEEIKTYNQGNSPLTLPLPEELDDYLKGFKDKAINIYSIII